MDWETGYKLEIAAKGPDGEWHGFPEVTIHRGAEVMLAIVAIAAAGYGSQRVTLIAPDGSVADVIKVGNEQPDPAEVITPIDPSTFGDPNGDETTTLSLTVDALAELRSAVTAHAERSLIDLEFAATKHDLITAKNRLRQAITVMRAIGLTTSADELLASSRRLDATRARPGSA